MCVALRKPCPAPPDDRSSSFQRRLWQIRGTDFSSIDKKGRLPSSTTARTGFLDRHLRPLSQCLLALPFCLLALPFRRCRFRQLLFRSRRCFEPGGVLDSAWTFSSTARVASTSQRRPTHAEPRSARPLFGALDAERFQARFSLDACAVEGRFDRRQEGAAPSTVGAAHDLGKWRNARVCLPKRATPTPAMAHLQHGTRDLC